MLIKNHYFDCKYVFLAIILIVFWLTKPLSEGVYLIWMLPSFILQNKIKENKGDLKNEQDRFN